ncbi:MAG: SPOR domain-containing protein [Holosporaceae bacterium]|jgi:cell division protein FtsN|nr:SPOR domain-containing protein [Holosporaceae bacterium]
MCPFIDEDDVEEGYLATNKTSDSGDSLRTHFFGNNRRFILIGGGAALFAFSIAAYLMCSSSKPINLEELPVISADDAPFKIKPEKNEVVQHQDKTVYDNISGDRRKVEEKIVKASEEEVLSIPEIDKGETLSEEEKRSIIQAFEELAPEKEYQIKYVKKGKARASGSRGLTVVEEDVSHRIGMNAQKHQNSVSDDDSSGGGTRVGSIMVQISSVMTRPAAEAEYQRLLVKNRFLRGLGKKVIKVDLGERKGVRYRVQVGPFKNRDDAGRVVAAMKKNGFSAYISK